MNIDHIVKPIKWERVAKNRWHGVGAILHVLIQERNNTWKALSQEEGVFNDSDEAKEFCQRYETKRILSLLDEVALNRHINKWRPIEECPKEKGKKYDLLTKAGKNKKWFRFINFHYDHNQQKWYRNNFSLTSINGEICYYMEIPALPDEVA